MKVQVELPADQLIDFWSFCKAIAQALCPAGEQELKGIDCIVGKMVTSNIAKSAPVFGEEKWPISAGLQCVLLSEDGCTLDQLRRDQPDTVASSAPQIPFGNELHYDMVELTLPYKLTDNDREVMEKLLVDLPSLHYPMSDYGMESFLSAYSSLPNRPEWKPVLVDAKTIERRQAEQDTVMIHHQRVLQDELARERLSAVDANHVSVARFGIGTYLPKGQAIAYLERCGILHVEKREVSDRDVQTEISIIDQESLKAKRSALRKPKLTKKDKQEIVKRHDELQRKGVNNFSQQLAEQFGISSGYVRRIVREAKDKPNISQVVNKWPASSTKMSL
ncbi:hypothetical protein AAKU64_001200 [Undibacterium sp. GrIS 1.8]|uniref:hypothetical protein n=1 Tax=Undibacterium sp. GrIS 1.8 TaxID=3143934 RepID=UPI0033920C87